MCRSDSNWLLSTSEFQRVLLVLFILFRFRSFPLFFFNLSFHFISFFQLFPLTFCFLISFFFVLFIFTKFKQPSHFAISFSLFYLVPNDCHQIKLYQAIRLLSLWLFSTFRSCFFFSPIYHYSLFQISLSIIRRIWLSASMG